MKKKRFSLLMVLMVIASMFGFAMPASLTAAASLPVSAGIPLPQAELTWDSDTVLLENFNGSTSGEVFGSVEYVNSIPNLDKALYLPQGSWIRYTPSGLSQLQNAGSIEFFIAPTAYNTGLLTLQWNNTNTAPGAGYVLNLTLQEDGRISYSVWNGQGNGSLVGTTAIPLNTWSHIAITWDGNGSKIFVNGNVDASTSMMIWPASPSYVYLGYWGIGNSTYIDEFRISRVARERDLGAPTLPTLTSLAPSVGVQGATLTGVVITGTNLTGATAVTFTGTGVTANSIVVNSPTQITATVTISGSATVGARDVTVTTPAGTSTALASGFTITAATNQKIAFVTDRDGNLEIYSMNSDGTGLTNLTNNAAYDNMPAFSPDGTKIAFVSTRSGSRQIYVMNADGSNVVQLTNTTTGGNIWPAWSPDGTKITFATSRDGNSEIYVMNADGSSQTNLTNNPAGDNQPAWSPDGTKIAFNTNRDGNAEIYVMNADGSNQTRLSNNPALDGFSAWSPDGTKIAFMTNRDGNDEIYVMNADGTGTPTNLTNNTASDGEPVWSKDGTKIYFTSNRDAGKVQIYQMDAATGLNQTRLSANTVVDDWTRGKWVAPTLTTGAPTALTSTGVTLNGKVTAMGSSGIVNVSFDYGLTTAYGTNVIGVPASLTATGAFTANLTGLTPGTLYHYRTDSGGDGTGFSADATFTTTASTLVSIAITPTAPSIAKGRTQQFTATGTYSDTTTANITNTVTWASGTPGNATINSSGLATAIVVGTSNITAVSGSITSNTAVLTVTQAVLMSIIVTPANPTVNVGATQQFTATGTYSDTTTAPITSGVTWASSDTSKATINSSGLATGVAAGTSNITATVGTVSSPAAVLTVTAAAVVPVTVTVNAPAKVAANNYQFNMPINLSQVSNFYGCQFDVLFDSTVLQYVSTTWGQIGSTSMSGNGTAQSNNIAAGDQRFLVELSALTAGISGSGTIATIRFQVIGNIGQSSSINLANGVLSDFNAQSIPATWVNGSVLVSLIPGDANGDGVVNILDMTKCAREILGLDALTPGADANGDGNVNVLDMTKIARIILGLDP